MKNEMRGERRSWSFLNFKPTFFGILAAFTLVLFTGSSTQAQIFFGSPVTLNTLTNSSGSLLVGDKLFSNFAISGYNAHSLKVQGIEEFGSDYGIQFSGPIIANNSSMEFTLTYQVNVTNSSMLISQANLSFNGVVVGGPGIAEVTEDVDTNTSYFYGQMNVYATQSSSNLTTSLGITPPQPQLNLDKDVFVYTVHLDAFSSISTINQSFAQVPEPSTIVLAVAGLSGLLLLRRRKHY